MQRILTLLALALVFALTSCHTHRTVTGDSGKVVQTSGDKVKVSKTDNLSTTDLDEVTRRLLSEAYSWEGVPYRWGGNTRDGVDCSGFVTQVFLKAVDIALPRTSKTQHEYCTPIPRKNLVPGDLVFFATKKGYDGVSHVGIYLGGDMMIHASSSKGVVKSSLSSDYYSTHYYGAGRVERFHAMAAKAAKPKSKTQTQSDNMTASVSSPQKKVEKEKTQKGKKAKADNPKADKSQKAPEQQPAFDSKPTEKEPSQPPHALHQKTDGAGQTSTTDVNDIRSKVLSGLDD